MKFRVFSSWFDCGYRDIVADSREEAHLWFLSLGLDDCDCKIIFLSQGGARRGAGRPKNSKGTGKWGGQETVAVRIPKSFAENVETRAEAFDALALLSKYFHSEAEIAKAQSRTENYPRTWDKALKLLAEIDDILSSEPQIL